MMAVTEPDSEVGSEDRRSPDEIIRESRVYLKSILTLLDELDDSIKIINEAARRGRSSRLDT